jgi:beta-lactamase regulating signal transducer with metallopeptidase domain/uncharacterized GH25 family protein
MLTFLADSTWGNQIGWMLVHSLWQFTLVAILALGLERALQRRSSAARYWTYLALLSVMAALPIITWFALRPTTAATFAEREHTRRVFQPRQIGEKSEAPATTAALEDSKSLRLLASQNSAGEALTPAAWLSQLRRHIQPWLPKLVTVWIVGVLIATFRPLLGLYTVRRLQTVGVSRVGSAVEKMLQQSAQRLGVKRAVEVLQSVLIQTPVVVGYFRPTILLPLCVVTGLPESQLELILAHELAHIRRHDYVINLLQTLVETLFFYHPAVWWLSRQIRGERENCCDDVVMANVGTRIEYGRALLAIEELRAAPTVLSLAAGSGSLLTRIQRIAGYEPAPRIAGGGLLCVVFVAAMMLAAVTWAGAPNADPSPTTSTAKKSDATNKPDDKRPSTELAEWKPGQVLDVQFVNARTKEPLPNVKLELQFSGKGINFQDVKVQTTDDQGRSQVHLPNSRPDAVRIYPSKKGFVPLRVYWDKDTDPPLIPQTATVAMQPGTVWGGVVRNEKGEPIAGVKISVHYWEQPHGNWNPHLRANIDTKTSTDKDGHWRIDVMPEKVVEDEVRIFLVHPDYVSDDLKRAMIPMPVTARPSIESLRAETAVMTMRKGGTITGEVVDDDGKPIASARIYDTEHYWMPPVHAPVLAGPDGKFQLKNVAFAMSSMNDPPRFVMEAVQRNEAPLVIAAPGYEPELIHCNPNGAASLRRISLKSGRDVKGQVVDHQGKPIAGVQVGISNWLGYRSRLKLETKTDADGKFTLHDAPSSGALYSFYKQGLMAVMDFPMVPQEDQRLEGNYRVELKAPLQVAGSIVDAETGNPSQNARSKKASSTTMAERPSGKNLKRLPTHTIN